MARDLPLVVSSGVCVGCGACAVVEPDSIAMKFGESGTYLPVPRVRDSLGELDVDVLEGASAACPFSRSARDEDSLGAELYERDGVGHHEVTGYYGKIIAGHVATDAYRARGTSGGMTSWVIAQMFEAGDVDAVVHVASTLDGLPSPLSNYRISRSLDEFLDGRKSRYHVQTLADVLAEVRETPGRYALVGVPCFIKAVRLIAARDTAIRERIVFTASLFCGHQKSALYSQYLAWSVGLEASEVKDIDYRHKEPGRPPNRYCAKVSTFDGREVVRGAEQIPLANWGVGIFKLGACDYCDDIVGETADISLGDAWMPPFMSDWRGANVAIARSEAAVSLLTSGEERGALEVVPWTAEDVANSQAGAVRHRRDGLAVRLGRRQQIGGWAPRKRVEPLSGDQLDTPFARRMINREAIALASGPAFLEAREVGDLGRFLRIMDPYVRRYDGSRSSTMWRRTATWLVLRMPNWAESLVRRAARAFKLT